MMSEKSGATVIVELGDDLDDFAGQVERARSSASVCEIIIFCSRDLESRQGGVSAHFQITGPGRPLPRIASEFVIIFPKSTTFVVPDFREISAYESVIQPLIPPTRPPIVGGAEYVNPAGGWITRSKVLLELLQAGLQKVDLDSVSTLISSKRLSVYFLSSAAAVPGISLPRASSTNYLRPNSSVLAVVPHYNCIEHLDICLLSLIAQTRKPDAIVVLDDRSTSDPTPVVENYPEVTLLQSDENVGPYCLLQTIIEQTQFDGYLLQDSDDWSTIDRLELLLDEAERSGSSIVGCQEIRLTSQGLTFPFCYPLDVNASHRQTPCYSVLHPSTLISSAVLEKTGGFASGLRVAGDFEFQLRATRASRVTNVDRFAYFRRIRAGSLTTSEETGLKSEFRAAIHKSILEAEKTRRTNQLPSEHALSPLRRASPARLRHLSGPKLLQVERQTWGVQRMAPQEHTGEPVIAGTYRKVSIGNGLQLVLTHDGRRNVLPEQTVKAIESCDTLQSISEHAQRLKVPVEELVKGFESGMFLVKSSLCDRAGMSEGPIPPIASVSIITSDRPTSALRCLLSFAEQHQRLPLPTTIYDGSRLAFNSDLLRQASTGQATFRGQEIRISSRVERRSYASKLSSYSSVPLDIIKFGLFGDDITAFSAGANRNAFLLDTIGEKSLSVDDDIHGPIVLSPESKDAIRVTSNADHDEYRFNPDRIADCETRSMCSLIAEHNFFLGLDLSQALNTQSLSIDQPSMKLLKCAESGRGRATVTISGSVGDCALPSPGSLLMLRGSSGARLTADKDAYEGALRNRWLYRSPSCVVWTDSPTAMITMAAGFDNRQNLPPFPPVGRGEDFVFGMLLSRLTSNDLLVCLPHAVMHDPPERRNYGRPTILSALHQVPFSNALGALITRTAICDTPKDQSKLYQELGAHLNDASQLSLGTFKSYLIEIVNEARSSWIRSAIAFADSLGRTPRWWYRDILEQIKVLTDDIKSGHMEFTGIGPHRCSQEEIIALIQRTTGSYGKLLQAWDNLRISACELKASGTRLSNRVQ